MKIILCERTDIVHVAYKSEFEESTGEENEKSLQVRDERKFKV